MENENYQDKWAKARENADITFRSKYVARVLSTLHPPKAYVRLEGEGKKTFPFEAETISLNRYAQARQ
jgi:hypothetical protein